MRILTPSHKHICFTLLIETKPLKIGIQGQDLHIFLWHPKISNLKRKFFEILKPGILKNMTPKSQAKIKLPSPQYPFFNYFYP